MEQVEGDLSTLWSQAAEVVEQLSRPDGHLLLG